MLNWFKLQLDDQDPDGAMLIWPDGTFALIAVLKLTLDDKDVGLDSRTT